MKLSLPFGEISQFAKNRFDKEVTLSRVSDKEVHVKCDHKLLFVPVQVNVKLHIEQVTADTVTIVYDGGIGFDQIIKVVLNLLRSHVAEIDAALRLKDGHRVCLDLSKLSKAQKLLETVTLDDIYVEEDGLAIIASLKK